MTYIRRRGTAIVETPKGILVVTGRSGLYLLPSGAARKGESRTSAAIRELREETGLIAINVKFLFRHMGIHTSHILENTLETIKLFFLFNTNDVPTPRHGVKYVNYY